MQGQGAGRASDKYLKILALELVYLPLYPAKLLLKITLFLEDSMCSLSGHAAAKNVYLQTQGAKVDWVAD